MFSTCTYPKAVLGSSDSHLYPRKVRTNPRVLEADIRPPYWVSWRTGYDCWTSFPGFLSYASLVVVVGRKLGGTKGMNRHAIQFSSFVSSSWVSIHRKQSIEGLSPWDLPQRTKSLRAIFKSTGPQFQICMISSLRARSFQCDIAAHCSARLGGRRSC